MHNLLSNHGASDAIYVYIRWNFKKTQTVHAFDCKREIWVQNCSMPKSNAIYSRCYRWQGRTGNIWCVWIHHTCICDICIIESVLCRIFTNMSEYLGASRDYDILTVCHDSNRWAVQCIILTTQKMYVLKNRPFRSERDYLKVFQFGGGGIYLPVGSVHFHATYRQAKKKNKSYFSLKLTHLHASGTCIYVLR